MIRTGGCNCYTTTITTATTTTHIGKTIQKRLLFLLFFLPTIVVILSPSIITPSLVTVEAFVIPTTSSSTLVTGRRNNYCNTRFDQQQKQLQQPTLVELPPYIPSSQKRRRRRSNYRINSNNNQYYYNRHQLFTSTSSSNMAEPEEEQQQEKGFFSFFKNMNVYTFSVWIILLSSFLNLLGFTMAGPITPALGRHFNLEVGAYFGSLTSAYPLGMLLGLNLWPQLSDKIGRKPVMAISLLGSGIGLGIQSIVISTNSSLKYFLLSRIVTGSFAGSSPVSKAYLADIGYKDGKLPKYLAWRDAASTMAYIVGPLLGGTIYDICRRLIGITGATGAVGGGDKDSLSFVIGVSAAASFVASLLVATFVKETTEMKNNKNKEKSNDDKDTTTTTTTPTIEDETLVACPLGRQMWVGVAFVCLVSFLFNVGDSTFHAFFPALLRNRAGLDSTKIGFLYTILACISFTVSTTTTGGILKKFGPVATCAVGMSLVGTGLIALGLPMMVTYPLLAIAAAIYYCGVPLYGPTIPTMLLRCVPSHQRGRIMGFDGMINTIARIISPLIMGDIYRRYGPGMAFGLAGICGFSGAFITLYRRFLVLKDTNNDNDGLFKAKIE